MARTHVATKLIATAKAAATAATKLIVGKAKLVSPELVGAVLPEQGRAYASATGCAERGRGALCRVEGAPAYHIARREKRARGDDNNCARRTVRPLVDVRRTTALG